MKKHGFAFVRSLVAMLVICLTVLSTAPPASAQNFPNTPKAFFDATDYSKWQLVVFGSVASGTQTVQVGYPGSTANNFTQTPCTFMAVNGRTFSPIAVGVPLTISDATSETVTPTAVVNAASGCSFTATLTNAHAAGALVGSGTFGLQEAIQDALVMGGGSVMVDPFWSGTDALLSAALPYSSVTIKDTRRGAEQDWNTMPSTTTLLAAPTTLTAQAACDATHTFCSDATVVGSASWGGTVHGCITLVDINGNESPCSADASFTSVASKAIDIGAPASRADNIVGWKPYLSTSGGSYAGALSLPLLTQPTVLLTAPVSAGVCTLTTLETTTPACAIANTLYGQAASATGAAGLFSKGGAQFTSYPVVTSTLAPEIGSVSALQHNPNEEAHATYAYIPGNRIGIPNVQAAHIVFPITAAAQTTIGEVEGTFPLPANFMNYVGRTIEVCGLISKTSTVADTVDDIQIWWDAEGSNVTAGTPVQLSSIKLTSTGTAAFTMNFCQQLTTTVAAATATGGTIQPGQAWLTKSQTAAGTVPVAAAASLVAAVGSLNLALPAHLSVELAHTTGTDGAGSTLQGATIRIIN
jgi:hypothetical protein